MVGDRTHLVATLVINQDDIHRVRVGQSVRLQWVESPGEVFTGEIAELAGLDIDLMSSDFVRRANLPARMTSSGAIKPVGHWYQARVRFSQSPEFLLPGTVGAGKILVDPQSLLTQYRYWISRTFAFAI